MRVLCRGCDVHPDHRVCPIPPVCAYTCPPPPSHLACSVTHEVKSKCTHRPYTPGPNNPLGLRDTVFWSVFSRTLIFDTKDNALEHRRKCRERLQACPFILTEDGYVEPGRRRACRARRKMPSTHTSNLT